MRVRKAKRCRSATWWGIFICSLLLVGAYVIFDLLDVDGSQMAWPAHDMMVVAAREVPAERFVHADGAISCPNDLRAFSLSRLPSTETSRTSAARALLRIRQSRVLPRLNLAKEHAPGSSPTVDPV
jgi:hypothetical protein